MPRDIADTENPAISELDDELNFIKSNKPPHMPKVELGEGEMVLLRFMPYDFDDKGAWYLRYGQHWVDKRTYNCQRMTSVSQGGNKNAPCLLCDLAEKYARNRDPYVAGAAEELTVQVNWLLYACIFERHIGADVTRYEDPQMWIAHEFHARESIFEKIGVKFKQKTRSSNPLSILDPVLGNDFWYSKERKYDISIEEASPLGKTEEEINRILDNVWKTIIPYKINFPDSEKMQTLAEKAMENIRNGVVTNKFIVARIKENEKKVGRASAPASRGVTRAPADEATGFEEPLDEQPAAPPARRLAPAPTPAPQPRQNQPPRAALQPAPDEDQEPQAEQPAPTPAPTGRRQVTAAPPTQAPAAPTATPPPSNLTPPTRRVALPTQVAAPKPVPQNVPQPGDDVQNEDEDTLPTEAVDNAPPAQGRVEDLASDEAPPAVTATGTTTGLQGGMLNKLKRLNPNARVA